LFATHQLQELEILERFAKELGGMGLDGGGFIGTHALVMGKHCGVRCFEPNPYMAELIRENVELNGLPLPVEVYELALHHEEGEASFDLQPYSSSMSKLGEGKFRVKTVPIDKLEWEDLTIMKLDLEGNEYNALLGAKNTISRHKPVIMFEALTSEELERIGRLLGRCGYDVCYKLNEFSYITFLEERLEELLEGSG